MKSILLALLLSLFFAKADDFHYSGLIAELAWDAPDPDQCIDGNNIYMGESQPPRLQLHVIPMEDLEVAAWINGVPIMKWVQFVKILNNHPESYWAVSFTSPEGESQPTAALKLLKP